MISRSWSLAREGCRRGGYQRLRLLGSRHFYLSGRSLLARLLPGGEVSLGSLPKR